LVDEGTGRRWSVHVQPFLLAQVPVTRQAWCSVRPAARLAGNALLPQTETSWLDALAFCNDASEAACLRPCYLFTPEGGVDVDETADGYRLPTEAEWEHACRAGSADARYGELDDIAWHAGNSDGALQPVGGKQPNPWGLFDMIGNAWEWCWDLFDPSTYGEYRVFRGGGFADPPRGCRASCRRKSHPTFRIDDLGFRVAKNLE